MGFGHLVLSANIKMKVQVVDHLCITGYLVCCLEGLPRCNRRD